MEILVAYCSDCDLVFDFKNHEKCPECGELPVELVATSKKAVEHRVQADSPSGECPKCHNFGGTHFSLCPLANTASR